jgi:hypothetical protein
MATGRHPQLTIDGLPACCLISSIEDGQGGGGLFAWDGGPPELIDRDHCMGLAVADGRFARLLSSTADTGSTAELVLYDAGGVVGYHRIDDAPHAHDLAFDPVSRQWVVVASGDDQILWVDRGGVVTRRWYAPDRPPGRHGDAWHVNCVVWAEDRLLATAFGENVDSTERLDRIGEPRGFLFDVETGERQLDGLVTPHHPLPWDGGWIVCSSWEGTVDRFDATGARTASLALGGWTRGLAMVDGHLVVGVSGLRHQSSSRARLVLVDLETFTEVHSQELPTREIYDVVVAPAEVADWVRTGWSNNPARQRQQLRSMVLGAPVVRPVAAWAQGAGPARRAVWRAGRRVARLALPGPRHGLGRHDSLPPLGR